MNTDKNSNSCTYSCANIFSADRFHGRMCGILAYVLRERDPEHYSLKKLKAKDDTYLHSMALPAMNDEEKEVYDRLDDIRKVLPSTGNYEEYVLGVLEGYRSEKRGLDIKWLIQKVYILDMLPPKSDEADDEDFQEIEPSELQNLSQKELVKYLVKYFRKDEGGRGQTVSYPGYMRYDAICESLKRYPNEVSIVKNEKCGFCGGTLIRMHFKEFEEEPGVEYFRPPDESILVICMECKEWISFRECGVYFSSDIEYRNRRMNSSNSQK